MPAYTTKERILELCPPRTTEQTSSWSDLYWTNTIAWASEVVDAYVGPGYPLSYNSNAQRFPEVGSSPDTPALINENAAKFGHYRVNTKLKEIARGKGEDPSAIINFNSAKKSCLEIRKGETNIVIEGIDLTEAARAKFGFEEKTGVFTEDNFEDFE